MVLTSFLAQAQRAMMVGPITFLDLVVDVQFNRLAVAAQHAALTIVQFSDLVVAIR